MTAFFRQPALLLLCAALSGCYVVPASSGSRVVSVPPAQYAPPAQAAVLQAKLYPSNPAAQRYGAVHAQVRIGQSGHGAFTAQIGGETFNGDATRDGRSQQGRANGAAASGRYITCDYRMNSAQVGQGNCRLSDGAAFSMHISQ